MGRREEDFLGWRELPDTAYYGIHTLRATENFSVSRQLAHPELIRALAVVKQAAAETNVKTGRLDARIGGAIAQAADEVARGELEEQFVVDALQGGAGTSTNMNMNEVLANRALELLGEERGNYALVHPLDHVNLSQSTNDVYPTALKIAAVRLLLPLAQACADLQGALQKKEAEFAGVLKLGRTEMQDAVPITLGQEFSAWAEAVSRDRWRLYKVEERLRKINLGGTAIGTGINAERRYIFGVVERLRALTGIGLARDENMIDGTQNADVFVEVSGLLKACAVTIIKLCGDLRLLSSGPRGGFGELRLPKMQAGSSIMPGKVNPVLPEMATQVAYQAIAQDMAITLAAQGGQLELNAFLPLVAANLLPALESMARAIRQLAAQCISGIAALEDNCRRHLEASMALATALAPLVGYDRAAELAKQALAEGRNIKEVILAEGLLTQAEIAEQLRPEQLTRPGCGGRKQGGKENNA